MHLRASAPLIALAAIMLDSCGDTGSTGGEPAVTDRPREPARASTPSPPQRSNPASQGCIDAGGTLQIEKRPGGGEYGVCTFVDNRQCEEWALLRGECVRGGVKVTGYVTAAARYCAIAGGTYSIRANSGTVDERGICALPAGAVCDANEYFAGDCPR
jgi:hypothetical protein